MLTLPGTMSVAEPTGRKRGRRGPDLTPAPEVLSQYGINLSGPLSNERTLSPNEIAPLFGVTGEAVKQWIYNRRLPAVKLANGYWRVKLSDLQRFIQSRQESPRRAIMVAAEGELLGLIREALGTHPCDLVQLGNFADALLKAQDMRPAMLMIDVGAWPDAWRFVEKIRVTPGLKNASVLLFSSRNLTDQELTQAVDLQLQGCLIAPFTAKQIEAEISRLLQRSY